MWPEREEFLCATLVAMRWGFERKLFKSSGNSLAEGVKVEFVGVGIWSTALRNFILRQRNRRTFRFGGRFLTWPLVYTQHPETGEPTFELPEDEIIQRVEESLAGPRSNS